MPYNARVVSIMIASPGDVAAERQMVKEVLSEWNALHSRLDGVALLPLAWESHASPRLGPPAQAVINSQLLRDSDLLVAIFWTRLGTPTEEFPSGTAEEIDGHLKAGKTVMVYFSDAPLPPSAVQEAQLSALRTFRASLQKRGLIETYRTTQEFRDKFTRQLAQTVDREFASATGVSPAPRPTIRHTITPEHTLSPEAKTLLLEASLDEHGLVNAHTNLGGFFVRSNGKEFVESRTAREQAHWKDVVRELERASLIERHQGSDSIFLLTSRGYSLADTLRQA